MGADEDERLQAEIELLQAIYPELVQYHEKSRELQYTSSDGSFVLRLPSGYLHDELPNVLSAQVGKQDVRATLKKQVHSLSVGEEILDSLVAAFLELVSAKSSELAAESDGGERSEATENNSKAAKATVIVWLHHMLNTNKRKLALSPPAGVSGVTKPGYPGVLIYSGPAKAVDDHVFELRQQNWQAFQVRLEADEEWSFTHGAGVREVETMKDVVAEVGESRKEAFLEAMRMK